MKKLLSSLIALLVGVSALAGAANPIHFTETLPPAVSTGCVPVSNGYDWGLSCNGATNSPAATLPNLTASTILQGFQPNAFTAAGGNASTTVISATATYVNLLSTGADIVIGGIPSIATATVPNGGSTAIPDGSIVVLTSTMTANRRFLLQDNSSLSGTLLNLPGVTTEVVTSTRSAMFMWNAASGKWNQLSPNNGSF